MTNTKRHNKVKQRFLRAYDELADDVFAFCYARTNNREVSLDLTQDAFTSVWSYLASGKPIRNLRAFVYRTTRHKIIDYYRKHKALSLDAAILQGFEASDQGEELYHTLQRADVDFSMRALSALSQQHLRVIQMRYVDHLSLDEIAFQMHESKNTVSVRLHRALASARKYLSES